MELFTLDLLEFIFKNPTQRVGVKFDNLKYIIKLALTKTPVFEIQDEWYTYNTYRKTFTHVFEPSKTRNFTYEFDKVAVSDLYRFVNYNLYSAITNFYSKELKKVIDIEERTNIFLEYCKILEAELKEKGDKEILWLDQENLKEKLNIGESMYDIY